MCIRDSAWAVLIFLCDFVPTFGMLCRQADVVWTQMFTDYYEWFGVAAVLLMLLYNGQRGSGQDVYKRQVESCAGSRVRPDT